LIFIAAVIILGRCSFDALDLARSPSTGKAMRLFGFSITYSSSLAAMAAIADPVGLLIAAAKSHTNSVAAGAL